MAEGMRFCTGCGATIDAPPVPPAPPSFASVPAAMQPVGDVALTPSTPVTPVAPTPSKGSPVLKIVLIIVGIVMLIGILALGSCAYFVYRAKQRVSRFEKQIRTSFPTETRTSPGATRPAEAGTPAAELGIPIYPGATAPEGQSGVMLGMAGLKMQQLVTTDSVDQVVAFYKEKLGSSAVVAQNGNQASVHLVGEGSVINVAIGADGGSGKTKIIITSIGKQ